MQKKMIAHFVADSHEEFRKVCEELRGTGFTHVVVSDVPRSLWMWEMDRSNPYVNWSMGQCQIFKLVCPPELEAYLPQDHIRMCMDFVKTRCRIAAEKTGIEVKQLRFEELAGEDAYHENAFHGIWACASLLHVNPADLPDVLKPSYTFSLSAKNVNLK